MTIFKILSCAVVGASALISPALAQPDLPESAAITQGAPLTIRMLNLSPDGRYAVQLSRNIWRHEQAVRYDEHSVISMWEVGTGRLKWRKTTPVNVVSKGSFSSDSTRFFVSGITVRQEGTKTVASSSRAEIIPIEGDAEPIRLEMEEKAMLGSIHFLPDGQSLIGLMYEVDEQQKVLTHVRIWDAATGKLQRTLEDKSQLAQNASWAANPHILAAATSQMRGDGKGENQLLVWSLPELTLRGAQPLGGEVAMKIAIAPDGKKLAYTTFVVGGMGVGNEISLWDMETGTLKLVDAPDVADYNIYSLEFSPDSQTLIGLGSVRENDQSSLSEIWFWNVQTGTLERSLNKSRSRELNIYQFKVLPDGKSFIGQASEGKIEQRSLEDGELIRTFE